MKSFEEDPSPVEKEPEWTPTKGLFRGAVGGTIAAVVLIALLAPVAYYVPLVVLAVVPRTFLALAVAWILFAVVQRAAGFVGVPVSLLAVALTGLILLSHHFIFAWHGVPGRDGTVVGWIWLNPGALLVMNWIPLIGVAFAVALCHRGTPGADFLADFLMQRPGI